MTDPSPPPPPAQSTAQSTAWWKRRWLKLPTWAWILIAVGIVAAAAAGGGADNNATEGSNTAATDTTAPVCDPATSEILADVDAATGGGITIDETDDGWNYLVAVDLPNGRALWVTDVVDGQVVGLWGSLNQLAVDQSGFPLNTQGTDDLTSLPEYATISTCTIA